MKRVAAFLLLLGVFHPLFAFAAVGPIDDSFDWRPEGDEPKRTLNVCFHRNFSEGWRNWAEQAMDIWNEKSAETGWTFDSVPFVKERCDIYVIPQDISESEYSGSTIQFVDLLEGEKERLDGRANGAVLTIDSYLEETISWLDVREDVTDGVHDGWSTEAGEGTRDPIDAFLHEFSKAMRIFGDVYRSGDVVPTDSIIYARFPGQHVHAVTEEDVSLATHSATEDFYINSASISYRAVNDVELGPLTIDVGSYEFGTRSSRNIYYQDVTNFAPSPVALTQSGKEFVTAFGVFSDLALQKPLVVHMPIEDGQELVRFEKHSWDLMPVDVAMDPSVWVAEESAVVEDGIVTFEVSEPGYYALVKEKTLPAYEYRQVLNGDLIGEKQLERRKLFGDATRVLVDLLPAFAVGALAGGLIVWLWMTLGRKSKVESDRDRVADVHGLE